jgi:aspartate/methionine/tyrosine aminotransferase
MQISPFRLERYFARYEFQTQYLLSSSDCEAWSLAELLRLASHPARALWDGLRLGYTESQGHPLLRGEIAGLYETAAAADIVVAAPEEAIFLLAHALVGPGDHAVVVTPAYQSLYEVAASCGCAVTRVPLEAGPGGWSLDLGRLERALNERTRLLVVNFPHNPTGYLPSARDFDAIVGMARKRGVYLLGDEMYRLLEHAPGDRLPAMCDVYEKGISVSGLSKAFGLPGLRVGWLATRDAAVIERSVALKDYTTICASAPSEVLAIIALQAREAILGRNRDIVRSNLASARTFFSGPRFQWIEPRGGSVAFPRWTGEGTVEDFCRAMIEQRAVMIVPGSLFEFEGNHFRVGLGRLNLPQVLGRMEA